MPSDLAGQLTHTIPEINETVDSTAPNPVTLGNLNDLNEVGNGGVNVYLTSKEGIEALPTWFGGVTPNSASHETVGATSCAIITVDKGNGLLDAFFFHFYAYNRGDWVLNLQALEFGDHVGDWEHNMVRFQDGVPQAVWYSQHCKYPSFCLVERKLSAYCSFSQRRSVHLCRSREARGPAGLVFSKRHARQLRHIRRARPHDPQPQPSRRSARRPL
jgi:hypothetical protein